MVKYDDDFDPPAPVVKAKVHNPLMTLSKEGKAKVDSGACVSAIPEKWVSELKLVPGGDIETEDFNGVPSKNLKYFVHILFEGYTFFIDVISARRTTVLIGRDILNKLEVSLDGKNNNLEISDP